MIFANVLNKTKLMVSTPDNIGVVVANKLFRGGAFKRDIIVCFERNAGSAAKIVCDLAILTSAKAECDFKAIGIGYGCELTYSRYCGFFHPVVKKRSHSITRIVIQFLDLQFYQEVSPARHCRLSASASMGDLASGLR